MKEFFCWYSTGVPTHVLSGNMCTSANSLQRSPAISQASRKKEKISPLGYIGASFARVCVCKVFTFIAKKGGHAEFRGLGWHTYRDFGGVCILRDVFSEIPKVEILGFAKPAKRLKSKLQEAIKGILSDYVSDIYTIRLWLCRYFN